MTMNFIAVKEALRALLDADGVTNGYRVLGYQRQITNIEQVLDGNRTVQVFYESGDFDRGKGSRSGPVDHEMTFRIELYNSEAAKIDLAALEGAVDDEARAAAISTLELASKLVDDSLDEFMNHVYNVLMDTRNDNLQITEPPTGTIRLANTWVHSMRKDSPMGDGKHSGLTGLITFKCDVIEDLLGETGLPFDQGLDESYSINTDPELTENDEATPIAGQILAEP